MKPGYGDVRYKVYIWGFSCLDYTFNVLISWIGKLGLYNWFFHIYFTWCHIVCSCLSLLTIRFSIHTFRFEFIGTRVVFYARHLTLILLHVGEFLTLLNLRVKILEFGPWWSSYWSERYSSSVVDQRLPVLNFFIQGSPSRLWSFSFVTREHLLYCLYLHISLYSYFAPLGDVIFM